MVKIFAEYESRLNINPDVETSTISWKNSINGTHVVYVYAHI